MAVAIIDSLTTIAEVCGLQAHNMNTLADAAGTRIFSDDQISYVINNVIRFVYSNSDQDMESTYGILFAINTIAVLALNNIMQEAGYLPEWQQVDPFDKEVLNKMIASKKEDDNQSDVVTFYRDRYELWRGY